MNHIYLLSEEVTRVVEELMSFGSKAKLKLKVAIPSGTPMIMFANLEENELGHYDPSQNFIVLSTDLLGDDVAEIRKNVYLHELAHWADFMINKTSGHDKTFRDICLDLGADADYSRATVKDYFDKREKVRSKVEKLIALSSSDFEEESNSAIIKAQTLMEKYNLKYTEKDSENEIFGVDVYSASRMDVWRRLLMGVISDITGTFYLTHYTRKGKTLSFFGSAEQTESALYLWEQLVYNIEQEFKKIKATIVGVVKPAEIHNGIVLGLRRKVSGSTCSSLVPSQIKNEKIYCRITGAKISHTTMKSGSSSQFRAGLASGSSMSVPSGKTIVKRIGGY